MKIKLFLLSFFTTIITTVNIYANEMTLIYNGEEHYYNAPDVNLSINNQNLSDLPMPPVVIEDRVLVPIREVFEPLGATVEWVADGEYAIVSYNNIVVATQVGNSTMDVSGTGVTLDAPPLIINDKIMVPVRAISEGIGMEVQWDDKTRTVNINGLSSNTEIEKSDDIKYDEDGFPILEEETSEDSGIIYLKPGQSVNDYFNNDSTSGENTNSDMDETTDKDNLDNQTSSGNIVYEKIPFPVENHPSTNITSVSLPSSTQNYIDIQAGGPISKVETQLLEDSRLVIDIHNATPINTMDEANLGSKYANFSEIRMSLFQKSPPITRVVIQLKGNKYNLNLSPSRKNIMVTFEHNNISNINVDSSSGNDKINIKGNYAPSATTSIEGNKVKIFLPSSKLNKEESYKVNGNFIDEVNITEEDNNAIIEMELKNRIPTIITEARNNSTVITLRKASYENISFDNSLNAIVINKNDTLSVNDLNVDESKAINKVIKISIPNSASYFGTGNISINNEYFNTISINENSNDLKVTLNAFGLIKVTEDANNIYLNYTNPKYHEKAVVVLDIGHGGSAPGTIGNNLIEKNINLSIGKKIYELINNDPNIKVIATRLDDTNPSFDKRTGIANEIADLFISIHNNSAAPAKGPNGTETLYFNHNNEDKLGFSSEKFATIVQKNLIEKLGSFDRGILKRRDLIVLNSTKVPAVLVELGFLSNNNEAAKLNTDSYQNLIAQTIYESLVEVLTHYNTDNNH
ncbi:MAG: N-acetylmuramoyl-L-alanine amidase [Lachnospirales bacterium]